MKSNLNDFETWISDFNQSELFHCDNFLTGCANFHILTPILQYYKLSKNYDSYSVPIIKIVNQKVAKKKKVNILVAGVESELSAKALLYILELFQGQFTITFLDICNTPLKRIESSLSRKEWLFVSTLKCDFESTAMVPLYGSFDIIFSDLFLKQFSKNKKVEILNRFSLLTRDKESAIIAREYIGDMNEIISRWGIATELSSENKLNHILTVKKNKEIFKHMLGELFEQFKNTGYVYPDIEELLNDIKASDLQVNNRYFNKGSYSQILHLEKKACN